MQQTVDPEFAAYVDARQERWLRAAYLVYGDLESAEERLLHAFTRLSLRWGRLDDPDTFVLRIIYQPAMSLWWRNRSHVPAPDDDEPAQVLLAGLTSAQRAVLVLLFFEELTEFEASEVLGISPTAVHTQSQTALSRFQAGPGSGDRRDARPGERW
ncbi:MAG TPA: sigma factor-like helix-turn-helix DNA-binding protein [Kribbella sp.]|nr:sigma factor-like helix-turn-helix DNA-binding protein [Kribbella sp.]